MTDFLQLHFLTSYPPANLNRDDAGRPKTALMGNAQRLRVSSQALKRAWRTSELFEARLGDHLGKRTKRFGRGVYKLLLDGGMAEAEARKHAITIADEFGKSATDKQRPFDIEQLAFVSPGEQRAALALARAIIETGKAPADADLKALVHDRPKAADVAMFGRMLADRPDRNVEAAVQVAHALTVHRASVEDDYFTAVDDLKDRAEGDDAGAAHVGETGFGAGVFYLYVCVDRDLLARNLRDDADLAGAAVACLIEAAAKIGPGGKQASFASRAHASYVLAERGAEQPRSLSVAFLDPIRGEDVLAKAIARLEKVAAEMDGLYQPEDLRRFRAAAVGRDKGFAAASPVPVGDGALRDLIAFAVA